jgi:hypothetical protein
VFEDFFCQNQNSKIEVLRPRQFMEVENNVKIMGKKKIA